MDTELQKRLEEAADKYTQQFQCVVCPAKKECGLSGLKCPDFQKTKHYFVECAEHGYKEAIKQAKVWLKEHYHLFDHFDKDEVIADFETDINKLWEGEK